MIKTISDERIIKIALDHGLIDFRDIAGHNVVTLPDSYMSELFKFAHDIIREIEQVTAVEPAQVVPVAWGAFYFGGKRTGKLYSHCETEEQIKNYIANVHRSNDSVTLRAAPLYTAPPSLDTETRAMVLELCDKYEMECERTMISSDEHDPLIQQLRERMGAND